MTGERAIDRSPARLSSGLAVATAGVSVLAVGPVASAPLGVAGILLLGAGVARGTRRVVTWGAWSVFGGVVAAGIAGAGPEAVLVGTAAAVLAWDFGEQAINVGEQLGRSARTGRGEVVHAASSTVVAVVGVAVGYGLFAAGAGGRPVTALVLLLTAALVLAAALRD